MENPKSVVSSELPALLNVEVVRFKDKYNKDHIIHALDLQDLAELEMKVGGFNRSDAVENIMFKDMIFTLWLALRKEELSESDIRLSRWKIQPEDVGRMFSMKQMTIFTEIIEQLYKISGLDEKDSKSGKKNQEK